MDSILEILISKKEAILVQLKEVEQNILDWNEFLQKKNTSTTAVLKNSNLTENFESSLEKTLLENIVEVIVKTNKEVYSSEIVDVLMPIYSNKDKSFIQRRVSAELSEANKEGILYSQPRKDKNQHHLAKVWGLIKFKDADGNVKPEHKYKST